MSNMADVTISQLTKSIPVGSNIIPFSTGLTTLGTPISAIFQNADKIGLATTTPSQQLHINANAESPPNGSVPGGVFFLDRPNRNYETAINLGTAGVKEWFIGLNNDANSGLGDTSDLLLYDYNAEPGKRSILRVKYGESTIDMLGNKINNAYITGSIIQVVQSVKTNTQEIVGTTYVDIGGLTVNITPKQTSSKILITASVWGGNSGYYGYLRLNRNGTDICLPTNTGSRGIAACTATLGMYTANVGSQYAITCANINFLDSPNSASQLTYKIRACSYQSDQITRINATYQNRDTSTYDPVTVSTITAMEIAA